MQSIAARRGVFCPVCTKPRLKKAPDRHQAQRQVGVDSCHARGASRVQKGRQVAGVYCDRVIRARSAYTTLFISGFNCAEPTHVPEGVIAGTSHPENVQPADFERFLEMSRWIRA